ncbi:hypothetical protein A9Q99_19370 [Gammaproteobacteria bacterium 45_16_T64]|nr:hypothetical protein A9Q99_19370 [Gammaproteobacteria bacterium 45_16_T64]
METIAASLLIAIPGFVILMGLEFLVVKYKGGRSYDNIPDVISSLSSGIANVMKGSLGLVLVLVPYEWMVENVAIFSIDPNSVATWIIAILCLDFAAYWYHRWTHKYNFLWQLHLIHHAGEQFNVSTALRQPVNNVVNIVTIGWFPAAIAGIPPEMMVTIGLVHLYYQYWYHTELVGDLGFLEKIIMTPRLHAVHHAMNREYVDKNFSAWFCIWDRLFGTYQQPLESAPIVYGITIPAKTWNPVKIDFMHWGTIVKDMVATKSWKDKFRLIYKPTNWRPADVRKSHKIPRVRDVYSYEPYAPKISTGLLVWSHIEIMLTGAMMMLFFYLFPTYSIAEIYGFSLFTIFSVMAYTTLMEGKYALSWLVTRLLLAVGILWFYGGNWFGFNEYVSFIGVALLAYYSFSIVASWILISGDYDDEISLSTSQATG